MATVLTDFLIKRLSEGGDPSRAIRDVVALHDQPHLCPSRGGGFVDVDPESGGPCDTLRLLAVQYADHPEYQHREWLPTW